MLKKYLRKDIINVTIQDRKGKIQKHTVKKQKTLLSFVRA